MASQVKSGKAFEYALFKQLYGFLESQGLEVFIGRSNSLEKAEAFYSEFPQDKRLNLDAAAIRAVNFLQNTEPMLIFNKKGSYIELCLAEDSLGQSGDVRDILVKRNRENWEIGISAKNNHKAVKHPRLSDKIDFGKLWLGLPVSGSYFEEISPIFNELRAIRKSDPNTKWSSLGDIHKKYYKPLLDAFLRELQSLIDNNPNLAPVRMVQYLLGNRDFYKIIKSKGIVTIQAFNLKGSLNSKSPITKPISKIRKVNLPKRIIELKFKNESYSTLEVFMDHGWQMTFRIHNASSRVEPSFKFDINLVSTPDTLFSTQFHI